MNIEEVLSRISTVADAHTDSAIARALELTPQAIGSARKRGTIPFEKICIFAEKNGLSIDYLLLGKSPKEETISAELFEKVIARMKSDESPLSGFGGSTGPAFAQVAVSLYNTAVVVSNERERERVIDLSMHLSARNQAQQAIESLTDSDLALENPKATARWMEMQREMLVEHEERIRQLEGIEKTGSELKESGVFGSELDASKDGKGKKE